MSGVAAMDCRLCMCTECKCAYHQKFYCSQFKKVVEIHNDMFWKLTVCKQIKKLSLCIEIHKKDHVVVIKNAYDMREPITCDALHTIDYHIWLLERLHQTIILNDTNQVSDL